MRAMIIGAGAIGKLFAYGLSRTGHEVLVATRRSEQADALGRCGVQCEQSGQIDSVHVKAATLDDIGAHATDVDLIVLAVKSYDLPKLCTVLNPYWDRAGRPPLLGIQNGLSHIFHLEKTFGRESCWLGVVTHGCTELSDVEVSWRGVGQILIGGSAGADLSELTRRIGTATSLFELLHIHNAGDIVETVWTKAIVNSAINPLTALLEVPNGRLLASPLEDLAREIISEGVAIARACGVDIRDAWSLFQQICATTAENQSSMFQDIQSRKRTEIDALCGAFADYAQIHGIPSPRMTMLHRLIAAKESHAVKD